MCEGCLSGRAVNHVPFFVVCGLVVGSIPREDIFRLQQENEDIFHVDFAARVESSRATCVSKNYFSPLISCVLKLILVARCSGGVSEETDKTHY